MAQQLREQCIALSEKPQWGELGTQLAGNPASWDPVPEDWTLMPSFGLHMHHTHIYKLTHKHNRIIKK